MAWTVWGEKFETGELANTTHFQTVEFNKNVILRAIRMWVIIYDDPVFTDLNCKIYSNDIVSGDNSPKKLLHTSTDVRTKAEVHTLASGVKEIYFTFNDIPMQKNTKYNIVLNGAGYMPTAGSYIAWVKSWPDPIYRTGLTVTTSNVGDLPYQVYYIGAEL